MTHAQLHELSNKGKTGVGNGFRAKALNEDVELLIGQLDTLLTYLTMQDVTLLYNIFQ